MAIVATGDTLHVEPALAALGAGYHVLLEKPIAPDAADCARIVAAADASARILQIAHVLRYTPFYGRVHEIVASGRIGRILGIDMQENVAWWHYAHSYVRGKFRNRQLAATDRARQDLPRSRPDDLVRRRAAAPRVVVRHAVTLPQRERAARRSPALQRRLPGAGRPARTTRSRTT